jgi:hypothetical protein
MIQVPKLWHCLTTEWVRIEATLAWRWWRALSHSQWSETVEWREAFGPPAAMNAKFTVSSIDLFIK